MGAEHGWVETTHNHILHTVHYNTTDDDDDNDDDDDIVESPLVRIIGCNPSTSGPFFFKHDKRRMRSQEECFVRCVVLDADDLG